MKSIVNEISRIKIYELKELIENNEYKIYKEESFNKNWDNKKKSKLIESLLLNIPIIEIKLNEYEYLRYEIIDGREIVKTMISFLSGEFKLEGLEYLHELEGVDYNNLPEKNRKYLYLKDIRCIAMLDSNKEQTEEIFKRYNK